MNYKVDVVVSSLNTALIGTECMCYEIVVTNKFHLGVTFDLV